MKQLIELRALVHVIEARLRPENVDPESMVIIKRQLGSAQRKAAKLIINKS